MSDNEHNFSKCYCNRAITKTSQPTQNNNKEIDLVEEMIPNMRGYMVCTKSWS